MHACLSDRPALLIHRKSTKFRSTQFHRPVSEPEDLDVTVRLDIIEAGSTLQTCLTGALVTRQLILLMKPVKFVQTMLNDWRSVGLLLLTKLLTCRRCRRSQRTSWSRRLFTIRPAAGRKGSGFPCSANMQVRKVVLFDRLTGASPTL